MKKLPRILVVESVIHGVLKVVCNDGYEGVVDLRPTIARGKIFTHLQNARNFSKVRVSEFGHYVSGSMETVIRSTLARTRFGRRPKIRLA
jgi:hypothetical protein